MHFMIKYPPKRPTFAQDMTEAEREIMGRHIAYWTDLMDRGHVLVFGPVQAPGGFYGLGIVEADSEEQIRAFIQDDPAIRAGLMNTEFHPMQAIVPKK
ncbi:YciI family protein [Gordoniibacillus kamchatkensis]|nr:YciI family protein [Paenibacillus sp. VKM B-2647]